MSDKIINLGEARNARERPDGAFIRADEYGRPVYCFLASYEMGADEWAIEIWAYDEADARAKIEAIRHGLTYEGQKFCEVPA